MDDKYSLNIKPEINLQRLCILKLATTLWNREETKQQIGLFFEKFFPAENDCHLYENWNQQLTNNLVAFLHNSSMSYDLKTSVKKTITVAGLQICHWRKFVSRILELDVDTTEEILWTNLGTIDKEKIFRKWLDKNELETWKLFNVACILCLEEHIPDLWGKIPEDQKFNQFYLETIYTSSAYNIIAYWKNLLHLGENKRFRIGIQKENLKKKFSWNEICNSSQSIEETMFRISILECFEIAVKYFWSKLSDEQRKRSVEALIKSFYPKKDETEYARILYFLSTKLSEEPSEEYFLVQSILMKDYSVQDFFYASVGSCFSIF